MDIRDQVVCLELARLYWRAVTPYIHGHWRHLRATGFRRDDLEWTNPDTGEVFQPTMTYRTQLLGQRPDDVHIGVNVIVSRDYDEFPEDRRKAYIDTVAAGTAFQFMSYIDCQCIPGAPCNKHRYVYPGAP